MTKKWLKQKQSRKPHLCGIRDLRVNIYMNYYQFINIFYSEVLEYYPGTFIFCKRNHTFQDYHNFKSYCFQKVKSFLNSLSSLLCNLPQRYNSYLENHQHHVSSFTSSCFFLIKFIANLLEPLGFRCNTISPKLSLPMLLLLTIFTSKEHKC